MSIVVLLDVFFPDFSAEVRKRVQEKGYPISDKRGHAFQMEKSETPAVVRSVHPQTPSIALFFSLISAVFLILRTKRLCT